MGWMSTTAETPAARRSRVTRQSRFNLIWLIPITTLALGVYLAWHAWSQRGPTITITFRAGEGLVAGQSHIKHKDVDLGLVTSVVLNPDASHVIVTAEMTREATRFLTDQTRFWVVMPRLSAGQISGLSTLISGSYIELLPSDAAGGHPATAFTGLENPPVLTSSVPGRTFLLDADRVGSVSVGSPVFFRDLEVGTVLGWDLKDMAKRATIHAFVRAPYDSYVHEGTHFWNASGVDVKLGAQGVQVELESIQALLLGGVEFETPDDALTTPTAAASHSFTLYDSQQAAEDASFIRRVPVIGYFTGSLAGLAPGSPVTFRGLRVGQVTGIGMEYDPTTNSVRTPVRYEVQPERFANIGALNKGSTLDNARFLVAHGLRAEIASANFLLGQSEIALEFVPDAAAATITVEGNAIVLPTVEGGFTDLTRQVNAVLTKVNQIPLKAVGDNLNSLIGGVDNLANSPDLKQSLKSLAATLNQTNELMMRVNTGARPLLRRLPTMADDLQATLTNTNKLVASANTGYGDNSKFYRDLDRLLLQLDDAMQSLRVLADLLNRHPEALILGRTNTGQE
jgi:paraquat-inducible protein B